MYVRDGPDFVVLGTNFGQAKHPGWTANLRHHPEAVVEVGPETLHVVAAQVGDEEYSTLLPTLVEMYPGFDHYLRRRGSLRARMFRLSPVLMTSDTSRA
jgi:deazaflavin-dependent oxidoreductase (nitroreductase family)